MNRILAICHSLNPEGLNGVTVFLRSLAQTFTMERFASILILHDLNIENIIFLKRVKREKTT
jgi:hypothetical protein